MKKGRVRRSAKAKADLVAIGLYIAQGSQRHAEEFLHDIDQTMRLLGQFPHMGRARRDLRAGLRSHPFGNYLIFYEVLPDDSGVQILRVIHGARNLRENFDWSGIDWDDYD